ncbi:VOC family protein [Paenarthrobacter sp. PH39-S1]|uniref:VOC family protein n=1 Tax=Paenarthrobacter sp. PH39-S1 TaxID=3046204 RepID=UPI0032D93E1B
MTKDVQIAIDCADPAALAAFWAEVLGYQVQSPPDGFESWDAALEAFGVPRDQWNSRPAILPVDGTHPAFSSSACPRTRPSRTGSTSTSVWRPALRATNE